jgi:RNA polymerase sigma factor (sigma-70 family)
MCTRERSRACSVSPFEAGFHTVAASNVAPSVSAAVPIPPFQDLLDAHRTVVYRFCRVAVGPGEADDVFQETFLAALRAYPRLRDAAHLDRWLLRIASRKAIDHHRAGGRRAIPSGELPERPSEAVEGPDDELWSAVAALPPRQRVAVVHRHVLDRPYAEIAELMDATEETVRAHVYQGIKKLRELIA